MVAYNDSVGNCFAVCESELYLVHELNASSYAVDGISTWTAPSDDFLQHLTLDLNQLALINGVATQVHLLLHRCSDFVLSSSLMFLYIQIMIFE